EAEKALRETEEYVRLLLDSTGEGFFGVDLKGAFTFANRAATAMLGYAGQGSLVGRDAHVVLHHGKPYELRCDEDECRLRHALLDDAASFLGDESLDRGDGSRFDVEVRLFPVTRDGTRLGSVATFVDISPRKRLEQQLRQSQKMEAVGS